MNFVRNAYHRRAGRVAATPAGTAARAGGGRRGRAASRAARLAHRDERHPQGVLARWLDAGRAELEVVTRPTAAALQRRLAAGDVDVLHFIGHGHFDEARARGRSWCSRTSAAGRARSAPRHCASCVCGRGLGLVFLNACETARGGPQRLDRGVAPALVAAGVPAVVANQYAVLDDAATVFARELYAQLAARSPLGDAVREARIALARELGARRGSTGRCRWSSRATPASRCGDARRSRRPLLVALGLRLAARRRVRRTASPTWRATSGWRATCSTSSAEPLRRPSGSTPTRPPWAAVEARSRVARARGASGRSRSTSSCRWSRPISRSWPCSRAPRPRGCAAPLAAWLYALHPVSLLIGAAHGQFDAIPLGFLLLAVLLAERGRRVRLGAGARRRDRDQVVPGAGAAVPGVRRRRLRGARPRATRALALLPGALLLLPFAVADARAPARELFAYGGHRRLRLDRGLARCGVAGDAASCRAARPASGRVAALVSKLAFLAALGARSRSPRGRGASSFRRGARCSRCCWRSPCSTACRARSTCVGDSLRAAAAGPGGGAHAAAATPGLVGFYLFLAPGVLRPAPLEGDAALRAGRLWLFGAAATLAVCFAWLATLLREGREGFRAATDDGDAAVHLALSLTDHLERRDEPRQLAGPSRWSGLVGRPRFACSVVYVSQSRSPPGFSARTSDGKSGRCR